MNKKQIFRRLAQIVIVLIGISFITFLLTYLSPGDPVRNMFSATGVMPTEELVQQTRDELGLNDPFLTQYARWLRLTPVHHSSRYQASRAASGTEAFPRTSAPF